MTRLLPDLTRTPVGSPIGRAGMDLTKMALRVAAMTVARGMNGDLLHEVGRDAELGTDVESQETHHDLENDDLENVDTRPKQ